MNHKLLSASVYLSITAASLSAANDRGLLPQEDSPRSSPGLLPMEERKGAASPEAETGNRGLFHLLPVDEPVSPKLQVVEDVHIDPGCPKVSSILPLAEWINATQLEPFFQTTFRTLMSQEKYFTAIDSLGQYNIVIEPYGFSSNFKWKEENFRLQTLGVTAAGNVALGESWVLGGGAGYWHSSLEDGRLAKGTKANTLYFGPQLSYLLKRGYLQLMLVGICNMYDAHSEPAAGQKLSNEHTGWDILARVMGGMDIPLSLWEGATFFLQPNLDLSYLGALKTEYDEKGLEELKVSVENGYADFFRSRLAFQLWKEFYKKDVGFFIPSLSLGWVYMQPISQGETNLVCEEGEERATLKYPTANQLYVGAKLTGIHRKGFLLALGFDANIAQFYPVYAGTLRFEIDY